MPLVVRRGCLSIPYLCSMNSKELSFSPTFSEKLKTIGTIKTFEKGDVILNERSYIHSIPIVSKGNIKVIRTDDDGREILLYYIIPGESCIMSFLGGMHRDTSKITAIAEEETEVMFIPIDKVTSLLKEDNQMLDYIFKLYHKRFEELLEVVNDVTFKKVDERLLNLLKTKVNLGNSNVLHVTHEELANELGTVRVVVSRLLKHLEIDGKVSLGRNKITLV